ncbi:hypothetical protein Q5425_44750 [Amycolatopsis sp. A133]|uniref:hypothetical protein n=1 Tax=Amycolatopsis sp. A133 TaxID=3064472 RepID=UPI0027FD9958|nr:hypothetical protein [Amycolatopsis sp. A133]MDQ7810877.1 hypothetical protein [Amycolatopsis sp. A133]
MGEVRSAAGGPGELRSLEAELLDVRRYIRWHRSPAEPGRLWLQQLWSDLLLDRWSVLDRRIRRSAAAGRDEPDGPAAPARPVRVLPNAVEPLTLTGLSACLRAAPGLVVVGDRGHPAIDVCVHATERVDDAFVEVLRTSARRFAAPAVLVANRIEKADLEVLARCRVRAVLPRVAASSGRLVDTVRAVGVAGCVPGPDLLAELREHG